MAVGSGVCGRVVCVCVGGGVYEGLCAVMSRLAEDAIASPACRNPEAP